jgi:hypothetical protein
MHAEQQEEVDQEIAAAPRGRHAAPEGADVHRLIDLERDPNPGVADHAAPEKE